MRRLFIASVLLLALPCVASSAMLDLTTGGLASSIGATINAGSSDQARIQTMNGYQDVTLYGRFTAATTLTVSFYTSADGVKWRNIYAESGGDTVRTYTTLTGDLLNVVLPVVFFAQPYDNAPKVYTSGIAAGSWLKIVVRNIGAGAISTGKWWLAVTPRM